MATLTWPWLKQRGCAGVNGMVQRCDAVMLWFINWRVVMAQVRTLQKPETRIRFLCQPGDRQGESGCCGLHYQ